MPTTERRAGDRGSDRGRDGRARTWILLAVLLVVGGVGAVLLIRSGAGPLPDPESCTTRVGGVEVVLSTTQSENASLIAAVAVRRGLPARAVSIALATAFQESKLENLSGGDRDSVGLFQQRPSQGWGTRAQLSRPVFAANAFYDALVEVDGYQDLRITEAAQEVQRSAFPEAYEEHAAGARALASALTGWSPRRFSCVAGQPEVTAQRPGPDGLTPRAEKARAALETAFGPQSLGGFAPGGVTTGHMAGSAHYEGRAVDVFVRPATGANRRLGWAMAAYLVAHAERLAVDNVIFDGRIWSSGRSSEEGWRAYTPPRKGNTPEEQAILEHRDHVHVDVLRGD
jgi:hypothetical protein